MTASPTASAPVDVVCLGESMVALLPARGGRLADADVFVRGIGGAESNVACALAAAGHRARWVSRVGADGFGDHLVAAVAARGVDTSAVVRDPDRPTGVYLRTAADRADADHEVLYYRSGSAASALSHRTVPRAALASGRILHVSGITAALSAGCRDLMYRLLARSPGRGAVSFDVNHRPALWRGADGPEVLLRLARGADLVFVGEDEARAAWGLDTPDAVRAALPEARLVVVKRGAAGAVAFTGDGDRVETRAPRVEVVAAVGAGDAFAAGFLSGTLGSLPLRDRLRRGHLFAAAALTVPGDLAAPPGRQQTERLTALDDTAWGRLHLGPGWTGRDQEVPTP
ncbi:sugar kinase [Streptomyces sp. C10-9-1]|uniref:sugar kinase n=1 Tax=Streptomyces sp. C10-9-1 TaxID=1859285 RepID=UPI003D74BCFA